jgi:hypothetical protein
MAVHRGRVAAQGQAVPTGAQHQAQSPPNQPASLSLRSYMSTSGMGMLRHPTA